MQCGPNLGSLQERPFEHWPCRKLSWRQAPSAGDQAWFTPRVCAGLQGPPTFPGCQVVGGPFRFPADFIFSGSISLPREMRRSPSSTSTIDAWVGVNAMELAASPLVFGGRHSPLYHRAGVLCRLESRIRQLRVKLRYPCPPDQQMADPL